MPRREESVSAGTKSIAPVTIGKLPVYVSGIPTPTVQDSAYAQADSGARILIGVGAGVNAGQVAGTTALVVGENAVAWGDGVVCIGENAIVGQTAAKDGAIAIGRGALANAKNFIRIGSDLAFGVAAGDQGIAIGAQCTASTNGVAIGRGAIAAATGIAIGHTATTNGTSDGIAIGNLAGTSNTGVNHKSIAIGHTAAAGANNGKSAIAIGPNASAVHALGISLIAIGDGATANVNSGQNAIAIGSGATVTASNEVVFGDGAGGNHIAIFTIKSAVGSGVKMRSGADGSFSIQDVANVNTHLKTDASAVARDTRLLIWDVDNGALERVSVGVADSGGVGFKLLRVPN